MVYIRKPIHHCRTKIVHFRAATQGRREGLNDMPKTLRMAPAEVQEIRDLITALKAVPTYNPHDEGVTVAALEAKLLEREGKHATERQKENEAAAARDATAASEVELRDLRKRARLQVAAQFGKDSDELASTGVKKESEYKRRGVNKPKTTPPTA